jgi:sugar phosphate isomerase/epimerase
MWSIGVEGAKPAAPMTAFDLLGKARELGVGVVQYGPNLPLDSLNPHEFLALVEQAEAWGISIEIGTQGLNDGNLRTQLTLAAKVRSRLLRTTTEGPDGITPPLEEMRKCVSEILPALVEHDVYLAIENGKVPARSLASVVSSANDSHVGVTLDTVNSLAIPEGTEHVTDALLKHARSVHVKDFAVTRQWHRMGFSVEGRPAGSGQLNVPDLLEKLSGSCPESNAILELWPPEQTTLQETIRLEHAWASQSISYLRRYIAD